MRKLLFLIPVLLYLILSHIPAKAVDSCYDFDFTVAAGIGWTAPETSDPNTGQTSTWTSGQGWVGYYHAPIAPDTLNEIWLDLGGATTITRIDVEATTSASCSPYGCSLALNSESGLIYEFTPTTSSMDVTWTGSTSIDTLKIRLYESGTTPTTITHVTIYCDGMVTNRPRPLTADNEHVQWGIYDNAYVAGIDSLYTYNNPYQVRAFSNTAEAPVSAVAAGTVVGLRALNDIQDCSHVPPFQNLYACVIDIPQPITQDLSNHLYGVEKVNVSVVTIRDAEDETLEYVYYLKDATVRLGDTVTAGCILGKTIQLKQSPVAIGGGSLGGSGSTGFEFSLSATVDFETQDILVDAGVTIIEAYQDDEMISLYPSLTEQPNQTNCKLDTLTSCINDNPELAYIDGNLQGWAGEIFGAEPQPDGGVILPDNAFIFQDGIVVDDSLEYALNVQARSRGAGGDETFKMYLDVNTEQEEFTLSDAWTTYSFSPNEVGYSLASIAIGNPFRGDIEIAYACFAPITASVAPGSCYFANADFDSDGVGWSPSVDTTFGSGQAFMLDGGTIEQPVKLQTNDDDTPHTYTLSVVARLYASGSYTGQVGKEVSLEYSYIDIETFDPVDTIDSARVTLEGLNPFDGTVNYEYPYILSVPIEISEPVDHTLTLRVTVTDPDGYIKGLRIDSACIDPSGDGTFPGQNPGGGYDPPFVPKCGKPPNPLNEMSVGAWTYWLWKSLDKFFQCDLLTLLNKWYKLFYDFQRTVRLVMRYWIALVQYVGDWSTTFTWWLNGHFQNIAMGQVTIVSSEGGCHDFFCAIVDVTTTLANFLSPLIEALNNVVNVLIGVFVNVANLFFAIVGGLLGVVIALLIRLARFLNSALSLLAGIVGAFNGSTPTAIPGLPACTTDPNSSLVCLPIWVADSTIFAGRWNIIMLIILSVLAIHIILYAIGELKDTLLKTWGSS